MNRAHLLPLSLGILALACDGTDPFRPERFRGAYDLNLRTLVRDSAGERNLSCTLYVPLDRGTPLPDSFTTTVDARARRSLEPWGKSALTSDTVLRGLTVTFVRRATSTPVPGQGAPATARIILQGPVTDTLVGDGSTNGDAIFRGEWRCPDELPPAPGARLREAGYPSLAPLPGSWSLIPLIPVE